MGDMKQFLRDRLERAHPDVDAAMERTLRRQRLRARRKRGTAGVVAIVVFVGAGFGLWTAFRPAVAGRPAGEPTSALTTDQLARTALADALGLKFTTFGHQHPCNYFVDAVSMPHQPDTATLGYCIENVPGDLIDQWRIADRLVGKFPSALEEQMLSIEQQVGPGNHDRLLALLTQMRDLRAQLDDEKSAPPPTSCAGHELTIAPETSAKEVRGTPADDYLVLYAGEQYVGNGGFDTICDPLGNVIATVVDDGTPFPQPYIPPLMGHALIEALQLTPLVPDGTCDGITAEMSAAQRYCVSTDLAPTQLARWRILTQVAGTVPTQEEIQAQALLYSENAHSTPTSQPTPHSETSPSSGPNVAQIACTANGIKIQTPVVEVQADGVHFAVDDQVHSGEIDIYPASWDGASVGGEFDSNGGIVLDPPPGDAQVACYDKSNPHGSTIKDGRPITIINPEGLWKSDQLACPSSDRLNPDRSDLSAYAGTNPIRTDLAEVYRRAIPGILPTDEVSPAGYPRSDSGEFQWRVVRNGEVVGLIRYPANDYGGLLYFSPLQVCAGTGIGELHGPTAGMLGTPFEIQGFPRCDPYSSSCDLVYVSLDRYSALGGREQPNSDIRGPGAKEFCFQDGVTTPCGGQPPGTMWHALRMAPADAAAFEQRYGCGASVAELCT